MTILAGFMVWCFDFSAAKLSMVQQVLGEGMVGRK
jgi:hypothetical protein